MCQKPSVVINFSSGSLKAAWEIWEIDMFNEGTLELDHRSD